MTDHFQVENQSSNTPLLEFAAISSQTEIN
jgi:hypothetical protein